MFVSLTLQDGHVSDQVATMIQTFQNLQQSSVDRNMYPHGVMDYPNVSFSHFMSNIYKYYHLVQVLLIYVCFRAL